MVLEPEVNRVGSWEKIDVKREKQGQAASSMNTYQSSFLLWCSNFDDVMSSRRI